MADEVRNNADKMQYELDAGDRVVRLAYEMRGAEVIALVHTAVPRELEGQGIGTRLVAGALADIRARGLRLLPLCGFVQHYLSKHPEDKDLLAEPI